MSNLISDPAALSRIRDILERMEFAFSHPDLANAGDPKYHPRQDRQGIDNGELGELVSLAKQYGSAKVGVQFYRKLLAERG